MIYDLVFLALAATWVATSSSQSISQAALITWCIALFGFIAFRFEVGCDWSGYFNIYDQTAGADLTEARAVVEPAYALMFVAIHALGLGYPTINVLSAAVFVPCLYLFCRRQPDPFGALVLFFPIVIIQLAMSGIRQASGLGVLMLAFNAFVDGRRIAYCILVFVASLFHTSAIIFMPYAICVGRRMPISLAVAVSLMAAAIIPFAGQIGYEDYQTRYIDVQVAANGAPFRVGLVAIAAVVFWFHAKAWKASGTPDYGWLSLMSGAMAACMPIAVLYPVIGDRVAYYLTPAQIAIFTRAPLFQASGRPRLIAAVAPFLLLGGFQLSWFGLSSLAQTCYLPYRTWLFDWLT